MSQYNQIAFQRLAADLSLKQGLVSNQVYERILSSLDDLERDLRKSNELFNINNIVKILEKTHKRPGLNEVTETLKIDDNTKDKLNRMLETI